MANRKPDKSDTSNSREDAAKLTAKQTKFAELIIAGCSVSDAMRGAGYKYASAEDTANEGCRLLRNPKIAALVEQGRNDAMRGAVVTRSTLIARMEAVNTQAFEAISSSGEGNINAAALRAFLTTFDKLMTLVPNDSFYRVGNDELSAKSGSWTDAVFADDHVWFKG